MPNVAESALASFFAAAATEFEVVAERAGLTERFLRFGSQTVRLRFAGPELESVLLPAFGARETREHPPDATIDLWADPAGSYPWAFEDIGPGGLVKTNHDQRVLAVHETASGSLTLVDRERKALLHRVPDAETVPWWQRAAPLRAGLYWALGGERRYLVHAGAVGDERGCALIPGASGSGKTTVALAALTHNLIYLGDDYVLLDAAGEPVAASIYGVAKLDQGHLQRFPALAAQVRKPPKAESEQKSVLDVRQASMRASLPVKAVIVPRITGGHSRLRPISSGAAMLALAPSTVLQHPFGDGEVVAALADVVRRTPCFALDVGDDVTQLAQTVKEAL
jgi:hypothetical protein